MSPFKTIKSEPVLLNHAWLLEPYGPRRPLHDVQVTCNKCNKTMTYKDLIVVVRQLFKDDKPQDYLSYCLTCTCGRTFHAREIDKRPPTITAPSPSQVKKRKQTSQGMTNLEAFL